MVMLTRVTRLKDHRAVWKMQQRGSLGETLLHILIFGNRSPLEHASVRALDFQFYETLCSLIHTKIARTLIRHFPNTVQDIIEVIIGTKSTANIYIMTFPLLQIRAKSTMVWPPCTLQLPMAMTSSLRSHKILDNFFFSFRQPIQWLTNRVGVLFTTRWL